MKFYNLICSLISKNNDEIEKYPLGKMVEREVREELGPPIKHSY
jgi:hypothetical protein